MRKCKLSSCKEIAQFSGFCGRHFLKGESHMQMEPRPETVEKFNKPEHAKCSRLGCTNLAQFLGVCGRHSVAKKWARVHEAATRSSKTEKVRTKTKKVQVVVESKEVVDARLDANIAALMELYETWQSQTPGLKAKNLCGYHRCQQVIETLHGRCADHTFQSPIPDAEKLYPHQPGWYRTSIWDPVDCGRHIRYKLGADDQADANLNWR